MKFANTEEFRSHLYIELNCIRFICSTCNYRASTRVEIDLHLKMHNPYENSFVQQTNFDNQAIKNWVKRLKKSFSLIIILFNMINVIIYYEG